MEDGQLDPSYQSSLGKDSGHSVVRVTPYSGPQKEPRAHRAMATSNTNELRHSGLFFAMPR